MEAWERKPLAGYTLVKLTVFIVLMLGTCSAFTSVPLYHSKNRTSHCSGTFITKYLHISIFNDLIMGILSIPNNAFYLFLF